MYGVSQMIKEIKLKRILLPIFALGFVAACNNLPFGNLSTTEQLLLGCRAYEGTLTTLAAYRKADRLSEDQIRTVDRVRPVLNDACTGEVENASQLLGVVESGLVELMFVESEVANEP